MRRSSGAPCDYASTHAGRPVATHVERRLGTARSRSAPGRSTSREKTGGHTRPPRTERVEPSPCRRTTAGNWITRARTCDSLRTSHAVAMRARRGLVSGPYLCLPSARSSAARPDLGQLSGELRFPRSHALADKRGGRHASDFVVADVAHGADRKVGVRGGDVPSSPTTGGIRYAGSHALRL